MKKIKAGNFVVYTSDKTFEEVGGDLINQLNEKNVRDKLVNEIIEDLEKNEKY